MYEYTSRKFNAVNDKIITKLPSRNIFVHIQGAVLKVYEYTPKRTALSLPLLKIFAHLQGDDALMYVDTSSGINAVNDKKISKT